MAEHGQSETEDDARTPAVRAIYAASGASRRRGVMDELNYRMLDEACETAGVEFGAYDRRILAWLAQYEPQMCAVIAGIICRAAQPPAGTETKWALRIGRAENFTVYDENTARRVMEMLKEHGTPVALYSCQIGPWTKASETNEDIRRLAADALARGDYIACRTRNRESMRTAADRTPAGTPDGYLRKEQPVLGKIASLAVAATILMSAGLASAGTVPAPQAGVIRYGSPVCGNNWVPVDLGSGDYLNVYNSTEHDGDYTCVKVPYAGHAQWDISTIYNPVGWWLYPNISAGWEWGRYTCNDGPSAYPTSPGSKCMRFPVRTRSMGRVHASMRVAGDRYPQTGRYNVSWDIWFSKTARTPVTQNDAAEIMIWPYSRNITVLHQRKVYIDAHWWWVEYWNVSRFGVTWKLTVFALVHPLAVITNMYVDPLLTWAEHAGRLSPWDYLTAVDFGAEISAGTPRMSFSNYSLTGVS